MITRLPTNAAARCKLDSVMSLFRFENAIHLQPARFQQYCHARLGFFSLLHGFGQLPSDDFLDRLRFLEDIFLLQEVVDARFQILLGNFAVSSQS